MELDRRVEERSEAQPHGVTRRSKPTLSLVSFATT